MASAPVPLTNVGSSYTIVTSTVLNTEGHNSTQIRNPLQKFLKGEPKALGTVEIMIGLLMILFGIVTAIFPWSVTVHTGIIFWGSLFHISAGSLAVAASNNLNNCVVKATLVLNIFSTLAAVGTVITIFMDFLFMNYYYDYYYGRSNIFMGLIYGINGVLLVFSLLQFCISIAISAFTCKASCTNEPTLNIINMVIPERTAPGAPVVNPFTPHHVQLGVNTMYATDMGASPVENPPVYSEKNQPEQQGGV
ncbi:hypothetical protein KOW79_010426 [Hemibagrus wyckioides]|uniref:Membrane-spanning 4-domains subfamily A member 4A n=2 Tax=Hemibagrus wyckioides TaxID=337641 RepID=A0A9D3NR85_9TELE|nr:hypothetical protein KOW79_010426 [Hemibagrus wyckioides]